jgi:hypothetical protein
VAINPSANILFLDGQLQAALNLGTNVCIKLGVATAGPLLRPTLVSQTSSVLDFKHGPLVASAAHHVTYSGECYLLRLNAGVLGTIGAVTKTPATNVPVSFGAMAASLSSYTLHAAVDASTASSTVAYDAFMASGWTDPPAPLPITIVAGAGTVSHVLTFTYVDTNGDTQTGTLAVTAPGTFITSFSAARVLSVTASVAPVGTQSITAAFASPGDRYQVRVLTTAGGVIGVSGGTAPTIRVSIDDGRTYSRAQALPASGVFELTTYAGGLTPQATGVTLTFTDAVSLAQPVYGSLRVAGATVNAAVTITHVVAGVSTAFSVGVIGNAITVNSATDGGGLATSTAADVVAAIVASTAASALVSAQAVGTGLGIVAAAAVAGFANSEVAYTPKVEGVQVRHGNPGPSNASILVAVAGKQVTVYPVTDANGIQTSTATAIAAAVNASSLATLLLSAAPTGTGAGIVGMQGVYQALAVSLATGDVYTLETTPPSWDAVTLAEGLAVLLGSDAALDAFSIVHLIGSAVNADLITLQDWLDGLATTQRKYKAAYLEAPYMGSTSQSTWVANILANYTPVDTNPLIGLGAGEANINNPAYGTIDRRNVTTPYMARLMACSISELPSHVDCETAFGIQNALNGVLVRTSGGSATVPPLWQTEDALIQLNNFNVVTLRTLSGRVGIYVRQGLMFTVDGDDYTYVTNRRTADVTAAVAYDEVIKNLNANLLVNPATGQLAEIEVQRIEANVTDRIRRELMGGARQHISGVRCVIDRGTNFQATGLISGQVSIVGRSPATRIDIRLGYVRSLQ